jgi:hypothetical protein
VLINFLSSQTISFPQSISITPSNVSLANKADEDVCEFPGISTVWVPAPEPLSQPAKDRMAMSAITERVNMRELLSDLVPPLFWRFVISGQTRKEKICVTNSQGSGPTYI